MIGVLKKIWDFAGEEQGNIQKSMILGFFYAVFHMFQIAAIYVVVLALVGGVGPFADMVHNIDNPEGIHFFSLIARGAGEDIGAGLSLVLGVLTTQTYAQAVLSGKTDGAVDRAGVHIDEAEAARGRAGDRALSGAGRTVDGNGNVCIQNVHFLSCVMCRPHFRPHSRCSMRSAG